MTLPKLNRKAKVISVVIALTLLLIAIRGAFLWASEHEFVYKPSQLSFRFPEFRIQEKAMLSPIVQVTLEYPVTVDTPIKEYVCKKFEEHCNEALAVVQCESGWKEDALGINEGQTFAYRADAGLFQVSSVHWAENGGLKAMLDPKHNTDVAYEIFKASGKTWNAWYAHGTPCYHNALTGDLTFAD